MLVTAALGTASLSAAEPIDFVRRLEVLGPRPVGSAAAAASRGLLADEVRASGWGEPVEVSGPGGVVSLEISRFGEDAGERFGEDAGERFGEDAGERPGEGVWEVVLAAHLDSVRSSVGAADNASGCAVLLATLSDLGRLPLRHTVTALFFDGEEDGLLGSRAWVEGLAPERRDRILAVVVLDTLGLPVEGPPLVLPLAVRAGESRGRRTPAWLIHTALRAGASVGFAPAVGDRRLPLPAQWVLRSVVTPYASDDEAFTAAGVPALLLTDFSLWDPYSGYHAAGDVADALDPERLEHWATWLGAVVLRLDGIDGRPRWGDEALVLRRVWTRRDLVWMGFALWALLVLRHFRASRLQSASPSDSRSRRAGFAGSVFRLLSLLAAWWVPVLAVLVTYPVALLDLLRSRRVRRARVLEALALLPLLAWAILIARASAEGLVAGWGLGVMATALLVATPLAFVWQLESQRPSTAEPEASLTPTEDHP